MAHSYVSWNRPAILTLERLRQEDHELETSLECIVRPVSNTRILNSRVLNCRMISFCLCDIAQNKCWLLKGLILPLPPRLFLYISWYSRCEQTISWYSRCEHTSHTLHLKLQLCPVPTAVLSYHKGTIAKVSGSKQVFPPSNCLSVTGLRRQLQLQELRALFCPPRTPAHFLTCTHAQIKINLKSKDKL